MYDKIFIVGNLGRDPELRYTAAGKAVANLSVATNRQYTNANGEQVKVTTWYRVSVWGKQAEACNQYLRKGRKVLIEGRLNPDPETGGPRIYTRQDGTMGASYEVAAQTVRFLSSRTEDGADPTPAPASVSPGPAVPDDDIPF